jgi:prepilin-type N-terminal cleavage/methylation domain-containing protein
MPSKSFKNLRSNQGVTLVELLISLVIISFALIPIVNFYNFYLRETNRTHQETRLKFLAQEEMERFIALDYRDSALDCFSNTTGVTNFYERDDFLVKTNVVFIDPETGEIPEIYPASTNDDTLLKRVTVSVSKQNQNSNQVDFVYFKSP